MNLFLETFKEQPLYKQIVLFLFASVALSLLALVAIYAWVVVAAFAACIVFVWGIIFTSEFISDYKHNKRHSNYRR